MGEQGTGSSTSPSRGGDVGNEISGLILGPNVQAHSLAGGAHFYYPQAPEQPLPIPRQLRRPPAHFTNRASELRELTDLTRELHESSRCPIVVLRGPGGVGKTSLALRWLHSRHRNFADGQLYTDLGDTADGEPTSVSEVVGQFLRALGITAAQVPMTFAERVALYRSITAERSLAVLLDNARSAAQVRALTPYSHRCVVVVTSRGSLYGLLTDGARLLDVGPFDHPAAVELLTRSLGPDRVDAEPEPTATLASLCGGMPIALSVVAARLNARPQRSLSRAARELEDERQRLAALSLEEGLSVRANFDISYSELDPAAARAYRLLGLHPGPDFGPEVAAAGTDTSPTAISPVLDVLIEASLLEEVAEDRFRFHDLLRIHARERAAVEDSRSTRGEVVHAMIEWYLMAAREAYRLLMPARRLVPYEFDLPVDHQIIPAAAGMQESALEWMEQQRLNLLAAVRTAHAECWHELAWHVADVLRPLFLLHKHYTDAMEIDEIALRSARAWGKGTAEISMLKRLSESCLAVGKLEQAQQYARNVLELARRLHDPHGTAGAHERLAHVYLHRGQHEQAAEHFQVAGQLCRESGRPRSEALALIELARALIEMNRANEALPALERAEQLFSGLEVADQYNEARLMITQGRARAGVGDRQLAEELLSEAQRRMAALGSAFETAQAREALGDLAVAGGQWHSAREHYAAAATAYGHMGSFRTRLLAEKIAALPDGL